MALKSARRGLLAGVGAACLAVSAMTIAHAETLSGALAKAYENNPPLNALRAAQRLLDEQVAVAKSGYRPNVNAVIDYGYNKRSSRSAGPTASIGVEVTQNLFDGFQTRNAVRGARAGVFSGQEALRGGEQDTLLGTVQAYVAVIRDQRIVGFRRQNIAFLNEQLSAAQARFDVGEGTRTDVAQARAERAAAVAELEAAKAALRASEANYIQIVGDAPTNLQTPSAAKALLPQGLEQAISQAQTSHPDVRRAQFDVEQTLFGVKQVEGQYLPQLGVSGGVARARADGIGARDTFDSVSLNARLTVPLYQQGRVSAQVRQEKERLGQARINVDSARRDARARVVQAFANYQSALAARTSVRAQIQRLVLRWTVWSRSGTSANARRSTCCWVSRR